MQGQPFERRVADLMDRLAQSDWQIAVVISGGASGVVPHCLRRPGASLNFVEVCIPYSRAAMRHYCEGDLDGKSASIETARQAARISFERALKLSDREQYPAAGIGLVAALPTLPARDQVHQVHVSLKTKDVTKDWSHVFDSGATDRTAAEQFVDTMFFDSVAALLSL